MKLVGSFFLLQVENHQTYSYLYKDKWFLKGMILKSFKKKKIIKKDLGLKDKTKI